MNTDTNTTATSIDANGVDVMDEFGRTEAERTVILASAQADLVNAEVEAGRHESYDDALAYVIERGFAEINRQRESARKAEAARKAAKGQERFRQYLALDPTIVTRPDMLQKLLAECGITNGNGNK